MAQFAREKWTRRSWLLAGLTIPLFSARANPILDVTFDGDDLHVAAPKLHFLTGRPLARLKDANTVVFVSKLSLFREPPGPAVPFHLRIERFTVSYDIWEEKFKVVLPMEGRSKTDLSLLDAETWCLDNLAVSALGVEPFRPFWLSLDLRTVSQRELSSLAGEGGISMRGLIDLLSRKPGSDQDHWTAEAGPLRLADLPRKIVRRTRNG
jgi:hypothetical protein